MLQGTTVLDLSSVGPAARASRWLADYGAHVIKIGPKDPSLQIEPATTVFIQVSSSRVGSRVRWVLSMSH